MAKVVVTGRKNFGRNRGRPSAVLVTATRYQRPTVPDREALAVTELTAQDIAAIKSARIPQQQRYHSADMK